MLSKSRTERATIKNSTGSIQYFWDLTSEWISYGNSRKNHNGKYVTPNYCWHYKMLEPGVYVYNDDSYFTNASQLHHLPSVSVFQAEGLKHAYIGLEFQKNNSFEIIPFLMDWDSTLKSFADRFKNRADLSQKDLPSYGEAKWGLLPLLGEVKSLIDSFKDIQSKIFDELASLQGKRITRRIPFRFRGGSDGFDYEVEAVLILQGYLTGNMNFPVDPGSLIEVLLDEIGFKPTLATVWEVIPLSFVVDYFFPVGKFLQSLHPQTWFNPTFSFSGTYSIKAGVELRGSGTSHKGFGGYYSVYIREAYSGPPLPSRPLVTPEFLLDPDDIGWKGLDVMYLLGKAKNWI